MRALEHCKSSDSIQRDKDPIYLIIALSATNTSAQKVEHIAFHLAHTQLPKSKNIKLMVGREWTIVLSIPLLLDSGN